MKRIVILGAGGHAHVVADIIRANGDIVEAFLDDDLEQENCVGPISCYKDYRGCEFIIGIGNSAIREKMSRIDVKWHTAIHPTAVISGSSEIKAGTVVMPNVVINARTIVGNHCIINTGAIIEHDGSVGNYSHISVGVNLGGTVCIGKNCWIGIGATIKNNISICDDAVVGAGAVVVNNIEEKGTYIGVPAKRK